MSQEHLLGRSFDSLRSEVDGIRAMLASEAASVFVQLASGDDFGSIEQRAITGTKPNELADGRMQEAFSTLNAEIAPHLEDHLRKHSTFGQAVIRLETVANALAEKLDDKSQLPDFILEALDAESEYIGPDFLNLSAYDRWDQAPVTNAIESLKSDYRDPMTATLDFFNPMANALRLHDILTGMGWIPNPYRIPNHKARKVMHDVIPHVLRISNLRQEEINALQSSGIEHTVGRDPESGEVAPVPGRMSLQWLREVAQESILFNDELIELFPQNAGCPMGKRALLADDQFQTAIEIIWPWAVDQVVATIPRLTRPAPPKKSDIPVLA